MQESLHTISPLTSPMDQMKSKRNLVVGLVVLAIIVAGGAIGYTLLQKNKQSVENKTLTPEQKAAAYAELKSMGGIAEQTLTVEEKTAAIKAQAKAVATAPTLTPEEKADIIKQMNSR